METHCLSREYLTRLIETELEGKALLEEEEGLMRLIEAWKNWEIELICFATSLLRILENRQKQSEDVMSLLDAFRSLVGDSGFLLEVDGYSQTFVEYMFRFVRQSSLPLEDNLLEIRQNLSEHKYNYR